MDPLQSVKDIRLKGTIEMKIVRYKVPLDEVLEPLPNDRVFFDEEFVNFDNAADLFDTTSEIAKNNAKQTLYVKHELKAKTKIFKDERFVLHQYLEAKEAPNFESVKTRKTILQRIKNFINQLKNKKK